MRRVPQVALIATALAAMFVAGGCSDNPPEPADAAPQFAYARTFDDGPVRFTLRLDKIDASLSDRLLLEQELRIPAGFESEFPEYLPEDFEGFAVVNIRYPDGPVPPRVEDSDSDSDSDSDADTDADADAHADRHAVQHEPHTRD